MQDWQAPSQFNSSDWNNIALISGGTAFLIFADKKIRRFVLSPGIQLMTGFLILIPINFFVNFRKYLAFSMIGGISLSMLLSLLIIHGLYYTVNKHQYVFDNIE